MNRTTLTFAGILASTILLADLAVHVGSWITPTGGSYPWNPIGLFNSVMLHRQWPPAATPLVWITVIAGVAAIIVTAIRDAPYGGVDRKQSLLMRGNNIATVLDGRRREEAASLHPDADTIPAGLPIGTIIGRRATLWQGWRDCAVMITGPGRGKTSSQVVPKILAAPGASIFTSRRVDGVREIIAGRGAARCWVFDPQRIFRKDTRPDFVFNPLAGIRDAEAAGELAEIFEAATKDATSKTDAQFDTQGRDLLANALLAAAVSGKTLEQVHTWLNRKDGEAIQEILQERGYTGEAMTMEGLEATYDKTRGSVYSTAQRMASSLSNKQLLAWTSTPGVRAFDPATFLNSQDTLIMLSKRGRGSAGVLLTALLRNVCKTGEAMAEDRGGRLRTPVTVELDECANIVRWPELPDLYSFYGGLGIVLTSYLQSWAQGVKEFGTDGMTAMWNAAGIRIYGGGESPQSDFLRRFSTGIGQYNERIRASNGIPAQLRARDIFTVDELANLPKWRALVDISDARPVLVKTTPWFKDKTLADRIGDITQAPRTAELDDVEVPIVQPL